MPCSDRCCRPKVAYDRPAADLKTGHAIAYLLVGEAFSRGTSTVLRAHIISGHTFDVAPTHSASSWDVD